MIRDDKAVLDFFAENSKLPAGELAVKVLSNTDFWGENLADKANAAEAVEGYLEEIRTSGMRKAIEKTFN